MKKSLGLALILALVFSTVALAAGFESFPYTSTVGVKPVVVDPFKGGDAANECGRTDAAWDFAYKINDNTSGNPEVTTAEGNVITITNSDGYMFDWASTWPTTAVIVKASSAANIFYYNPAAYLDTDLYSVVKDEPVYDEDGNMITPPKFYEISHATFCYNKPGMCYEEETAWAEGDRYVKKGNWAMYVPYASEEKTVNLIADYTNYVNAGTVTFSAPVNGYVTITVNLTGGAIFYYDLNDPLYDNNLKVQDYAKAPTKTPSPGLFDWKTNIEPGSTTGSIVVPVNDFYGVHLDIALPVPCQ